MRRMICRLLKQAHRDEAGQAMFEWLLVLPVILIFFFMLGEGTRMLSTWVGLEYATREGARYGAIGKSATDIQNLTVARSTAALTTSDVSVTNAQGAPGSDVVVSVSYDYSYGFPLQGLFSLLGGHKWTPPPISMTASTHMRIE